MRDWIWRRHRRVPRSPTNAKACGNDAPDDGHRCTWGRRRLAGYRLVSWHAGGAAPPAQSYSVLNCNSRAKDEDQDTTRSKQIVLVLGWSEELNRLSKI